jgi:hypothetical protein
MGSATYALANDQDTRIRQQLALELEVRRSRVLAEKVHWDGERVEGYALALIRRNLFLANEIAIELDRF